MSTKRRPSRSLEAAAQQSRRMMERIAGLDDDVGERWARVAEARQPVTSEAEDAAHVAGSAEVMTGKLRCYRCGGRIKDHSLNYHYHRGELVM